MISQQMQDMMNKHVGEEMYSSNLYLSMAAYCESISLKGFAHWMRVQAKEEQVHAMKFFDYLIDRGGRPQVQAIAEPPGEFNSPKDMFERTLAHEQEVTRRVHKLYEAAMEEKDYGTQVMLQWFISEQVEEEARASEILDKIRMIKESGNAIFWIDKELGKREG